MLTEYGFETKDEEMLPRAIELRKRMAGRRLDEATKSGRADEKKLKKMIAMNDGELETQMHENFSVSMAGVNEKITVARAEQQLYLESDVRRLHRDLDRASKLSKSRLDILSDLENRIINMRRQLVDPSVKTVEEEVSANLRASATAKADKQFEVCTHCQRKILTKLFDAHVRRCTEIDLHNDTKHIHETKPPVFDIKQDIYTEKATFLPQPPRNCRVIETGTTFIRWQWEEPVTDGGLPIHEYEMAFTEKFMEMNPKTKRYITTITEKTSHLTSLFCTLDPICHDGAKVVNLKANTEYNSWRIRCRNLRGWSDWVDMMDTSAAEYDDSKKLYVRTEEVEPPSPPLFFRIIQVTSSCVHLTWDVPFYDGGSPIVDYVVHYTVNEVKTTTTERDVVMPYDMKLNTEGTATSIVLRNLPADTVIPKIVIKSVNKVGLISEAEKIDLRQFTRGDEQEDGEEVRTKPSSRYVQIHREFDRAMAMDDAFIDTSFFTGVQQRLLRIDFIKALKDEMLSAQPDELERTEEREWMAIKELQARKEAERKAEEARRDPLNEMNNIDNHGNDFDSDDDDENAVMKKQKDWVFTNQQRRQHFKRKIESLQKELKRLDHERYELDTERSGLTNLMKQQQVKKMNFQLERDRVKSFTGGIVTSSVLSGAPMQYVFGDFMKKVDRAILDCEGSISEAKFAVMAGEERKHRVKYLLVREAEELKNRRALFLQFDLKHKAAMHALNKLNNADADLKLLRRCFHDILDFSEERKRVRQLFAKVMARRLFLAKKNAFGKWNQGDDHVNDHDLLSIEEDPFISVGGLMLDNAKQSRMDLQADLRAAIAITTNISHKVNLATIASDNRKMLTRNRNFRFMEEGMDHLRYEMNGLHYLYEADGYAQAGNFIMAYSTYEAQILYLRTAPQLDIKQLSITHGHMGRMFLLQSKFDRAIVEFSRQLSLANEIDDAPEQAEAYFGIGKGYMEIRDYDNAIRYLNIAQTRLSSLGNMSKYCNAMRASKEVYARLGDHEACRVIDEKIDRIEGELEFKLNLMKGKLQDLTLRMNNSNADIEHCVEIERTSLRAIQLKVEINDLHDELEDVEAEEEDAEEAVAKIEALLNEIQMETNMAYATDETEMISNLVHDQPQLMDVEELKNRLSYRKKTEVKNLETANAELNRLKAKVRNLEDNIHDKDALLDLENGPLMKNSRHDQAFRCISFCAANAKGNEVTGTNTGGSENFVAAEGNNIHVIDYHSGELLHVYAGEAKGTHREGMSHESFGHGGVVTCLVHDCTHIYSGSTDETVRKWNVSDHKQEIIYRGHEGSITAIAVDATYMCSGSADATIRLWNKHTGFQMRTVYGHHKSILSLDLGATWMLSGSADEEVRVWSVKEKSKHTTNVDCRHRLIAHEVPVCCVKYSKLEIISADIKGRIFIWWMKTGEVIKRIQAHEGAIKSMQFDAVYIVSGGVDSSVTVVDIATGEVQQKLRGHSKSVSAVAFDSERIISAGGDNTLRYWAWGKKIEPKNKFHVLDKGQSLIAVCKMFPGLTMEDIMKWNGIKEAKQIYPGMKLIVKKGDPNELTDAEKAAEERERRREAASQLTSKRISAKGMLKESLKKYDRVHRNATDMDFHSLGNRMFSQSKKDQELFTDKIDLDANPHALSTRLKRDFEAERRAQNIPKPKGVYFMNKENEEEWGPTADNICVAMLSLFIEYDAYEMLLEVKREVRSTQSVIGRINVFEKKVEDLGGDRAAAIEQEHYVKKRRFLMPEERKALRKKERKEKKKQEKLKLLEQQEALADEWMEQQKRDEEEAEKIAAQGGNANTEMVAMSRRHETMSKRHSFANKGVAQSASAIDIKSINDQWAAGNASDTSISLPPVSGASSKGDIQQTNNNNDQSVSSSKDETKLPEL
jgi:WD40 repeat protein